MLKKYKENKKSGGNTAYCKHKKIIKHKLKRKKIFDIMTKDLKKEGENILINDNFIVVDNNIYKIIVS